MSESSFTFQMEDNCLLIYCSFLYNSYHSRFSYNYKDKINCIRKKGSLYSVCVFSSEPRNIQKLEKVMKRATLSFHIKDI